MELTTALDCRTCGACCRGFAVIPLVEGDTVPAELVTRTHDRVSMRTVRVGRTTTCAALVVSDGDHACSIYEQRPQVCRAFAPGSAMCTQARGLERKA